MSDGRKRILSPFTRCKKRKAWNKTREKRRQTLVETGRGSYYKKKRLEEFVDSKGVFYNVNESDMMMRVIIKIMDSSSYRRVLPIVATK